MLNVLRTIAFNSENSAQKCFNAKQFERIGKKESTVYFGWLVGWFGEKVQNNAPFSLEVIFLFWFFNFFHFPPLLRAFKTNDRKK